MRICLHFIYERIRCCLGFQVFPSIISLNSVKTAAFKPLSFNHRLDHGTRASVHWVSKHEKTNESTRLQAQSFCCFRVFENPVEHEARVLLLLKQMQLEIFYVSSCASSESFCLLYLLVHFNSTMSRTC